MGDWEHRRHNGNDCVGQALFCDVVSPFSCSKLLILITLEHLPICEPLLSTHNSIQEKAQPFCFILYLNEQTKLYLLFCFSINFLCIVQHYVKHLLTYILTWFSYSPCTQEVFSHC